MATNKSHSSLSLKELEKKVKELEKQLKELKELIKKAKKGKSPLGLTS